RGGTARGRGRPGARSAHTARARGAPAHRPGLYVQGDRRRAEHLGQDGRGPRLGGPAQAPALQPPRAQPLGDATAARRARLARLETLRALPVGVGSSRAWLTLERVRIATAAPAR